MSDLQLALIVVGIVVVAAVYAYNRYQELQLRRRVESRFAQRPDDVLMSQPPASALAYEDERVEPRFDPQAQAAAGSCEAAERTG
jgi:hypothetical protein